MLHEKSCGAIVYRKYHGNTEILLIKHINSGHWSFPKGHVESGETEIETAIREIKEETDIDVIIDPTFRETVSYSPRKDTIKVVVYFLAKAKNVDFHRQEDEIAEFDGWIYLMPQIFFHMKMTETLFQKRKPLSRRTIDNYRILYTTIKIIYLQ